MIPNEFRTLLLNRGRDGVAPDFYGEQFVAENFQRRKLTPVLRLVHQTLFGLDPDRLTLNYRLMQLMGLVHSTDLAQDVAAYFDSRVTYLPAVDQRFLGTAFGIFVEQPGPGERVQTFFSGQPTTDPGRGRSRQVWTCRTFGSDTLQITYSAPEGPQTSTHVLPAYNSLCGPVRLAGWSALDMQFRPVPEGTVWTVTANARPTQDPGQLMTTLAAVLGEAGIGQLLPENAESPLSVWRAVWDTHPTSVYRWAALLLAIALAIRDCPPELT